MRTHRLRNLETVRRLGYHPNAQLPFLEDEEVRRSPDEVARRMLCLHAVVAHAYGLAASKALDWLFTEKLNDFLTKSELASLSGSKRDAPLNQWRVEAIWTLAWCLGLHPTLDFSQECGDDLVKLLPDILLSQSAAELIAHAKLRPANDLFGALDLAYCLHWAVRDCQLRGLPLPGKLPGMAVSQRRHALEWVHSEEDWDHIVLDT